MRDDRPRAGRCHVVPRSSGRLLVGELGADADLSAPRRRCRMAAYANSRTLATATGVPSALDDRPDTTAPRSPTVASIGPRPRRHRVAAEVLDAGDRHACAGRTGPNGSRSATNAMRRPGCSATPTARFASAAKAVMRSAESRSWTLAGVTSSLNSTATMPARQDSPDSRDRTTACRPAPAARRSTTDGSGPDRRWLRQPPATVQARRSPPVNSNRERDRVAIGWAVSRRVRRVDSVEGRLPHVAGRAGRRGEDAQRRRRVGRGARDAREAQPVGPRVRRGHEQRGSPGAAPPPSVNGSTSENGISLTNFPSGPVPPTARPCASMSVTSKAAGPPLPASSTDTNPGR